MENEKGKRKRVNIEINFQNLEKINITAGSVAASYETESFASLSAENRSNYLDDSSKVFVAKHDGRKISLTAEEQVKLYLEKLENEESAINKTADVKKSVIDNVVRSREKQDEEEYGEV